MSEEGLDFVLDIDAPTKGMKDGSNVLKEILGMLKETEKETKAVDKEWDELNATIKRLERPHKIAAMKDRIKELENPIKKTHGVFDKLVHSGMEPFIERAKSIAEFEFIRRGVDALIELPFKLAEGVAELGSEMIRTAAAAERTDKSFGLLLGATEGKETLEWIESIAKFTEFTDDQLKGMAGSLAKVGFQGEGLTRALAASLDMAAFSGSGQEGASEALSSLARIKRTGRIDNRSLGGLGIGEKDFLAELSRRTGEGTEVLKKKIDEGKVDAEQSLEALFSMISKKTGKDLGGAGVAMSETLQARLMHLKDLPEQFFQQLKDSRGFEQISEFTGRLVEALDPESATGHKIMTALVGIFDTVGQLIEDIDVPGLVVSISEGMTTVASNIRPLVDFIKMITGAIDELMGVLSKVGEVVKFIDPINSVLGKFADLGLGTFFNAKLGAGDKVTGERVPSGFDRAGARAALKASGGPLPAMFGPPDPGAMAGWGDTGRAIGKNLEAGTRNALDLHSPSRVFEEIGLMTAAGFNRGMGKGMRNDSVAVGAFAMPAPSGGAVGRGPVTVMVEVGGVHIGATGGDAAQIAQQVSEHLAAMLPGKLTSAVEQLVGQAGSAA